MSSYPLPAARWGAVVVLYWTELQHSLPKLLIQCECAKLKFYIYSDIKDVRALARGKQEMKHKLVHVVVVEAAWGLATACGSLRRVPDVSRSCGRVGGELWRVTGAGAGWRAGWLRARYEV